jgi:hypothetical protein
MRTDCGPPKSATGGAFGVTTTCRTLAALACVLPSA